MDDLLFTGTGRARSDRRLVAFSLPVGLAVVLALWLFMSSWPALVPVSFIGLPLIFVVVAAIEIRPIRVRSGASTHHLILDEFHLVAGVMFATPFSYILGATLAVAFVMVYQRDRPAIVLVNSAWFAAGAAATIATTRAVLGSAEPFSYWGALAVAAGLAASSVVNTGMLALLESESGGSVTEVFVSLRSWIGTTLATGLCGYGAFAVLHFEPMLFAVTACTIVAFGAMVVRYQGLRNDREGMLRLHETTSAVQRMTTSGESLDTLLNQAIKLGNGDEAEILVLDDDASPLYTVRTTEGAPSSVHSDEQRVPYLLELLAEMTAESEEIRSSSDMMAAVVGSSETPIGVVAVHQSHGASEGFQDSDRRLFEMFVNHASIALENSQLFTQLREEMARRKHQALHDQLTGLANRTKFDSEVRKAMAGLKPGKVVGVVLSDIDDFKEINDTLGHHQGDELLKLVAERLNSIESPNLFVARLGGDEFAAIVRSADEPGEVIDAATEFRKAIQAPLEIAGVPVHVHTSVGVSLCEHGESSTLSPEVLLQQADVAMYKSKKTKVGVCSYRREDDPYSAERLALAADLRDAVAAGQIVAHFQPELDIARDEVVAVEALARWSHPTRGEIWPDQFIPIAEASGLIRDLTYSILEQSLEQVMRWRSEGYVVSVAVNLSVRCLHEEDLVEQVSRRLERSGVDPSQLVLEITEGTIMSDPEYALGVLTELHDLGLKLSIDDFGTGYSSLIQLKHLPVDQVKIDRGFVTNMATDADDAAIARLVVDLGHALDLKVIAEGIEDQETLHMLNELGCDLAQGYFISRPAPGNEIGQWMRQRNLQRELFHKLAAY